MTITKKMARMSGVKTNILLKKIWGWNCSLSIVSKHSLRITCIVWWLELDGVLQCIHM